VLRPGGRLVVATLGEGPGGPAFYPVPWAARAADSFLAHPDALSALMQAAGFELLAFDDLTATPRPPPAPGLGPAAVMGPRMALLRENTTRSFAEARLTRLRAVLHKPA
jgi:hypothetical protein